MQMQDFEGDSGPGTSGQLPPPPRTGRGRSGLVIVIAVVLVIALLVGGGVLIDFLFFGSEDVSPEEFDITDSESYQEALFDIEDQFYRNVDPSSLEAAAEEAVDKQKEEGVDSTEELEETGLRAMAEALDDTHSSYLNEEESKYLNEELSGSFYGVGFMLRMEDDLPQVVSLISGAPAERAGIKKNDIVVEVDGKETRGKDIQTIVTWIRGEEGTEVELVVERGEEKKRLTFDVVREKITIPDLESEIIDGQYGYLKVLNFNRGVAEKVRAKTEEMVNQGVKGFILDLRNNPGGLMDEGIELARVFINEGVVVSYETKDEPRVEERAEGNAVTDLPLVVMINEGSASASEIVAGAIDDNERGPLVGEKTFGKGSVQKLFDLSNGGTMKLTVAMYYLPLGESIDEVGIEPDVKIEVPEEMDIEEADQLQLDKGIEVLRDLISGDAAMSPEGLIDESAHVPEIFRLQPAA